MLSRTANGLYWMSRYVERAENIARLIDAGRRMDALPDAGVDGNSEWASIVIASGCSTTFPHDLSEATRENVVHHLIFDHENPSSVYSSFAAARENARAMRIAVTTEVWDAINETWATMRALTPSAADRGQLSGLLDWIKQRGFQIRGAAEASMLRGPGYSFVQIGKYVERSDATARLVDVKYNVLLPEDQSVGGGLDYMQWQQILRAANSLRAFRWVYREAVTARTLVDFLILNKVSPRSVAHCYCEIVEMLEDLDSRTPDQLRVLNRARRMRDDILETTVDDVLARGLHEWLTETIVDTNMFAGELAASFGFLGPLDSQAQSAG
jgi:uncharacterized alpha-E superfamily protein